MNIKAIVASASLALIGATGATAGSVSAGCGVTIESHNRDAVASTVDWSDSDVRIRERVFGVWVNGPWKKLGNHSTFVDAGDTVAQAFTLDFGCGVERQYRLEVTQGASTWFEYAPSSGWTTDNGPHVHVD